MDPPRGWRRPQGKHAPSWAQPILRRAYHQAEHSTPRPLPRWKRVVLLYILPVCLAMVWQLGVMLGFLVVFLGGLLLSRFFWP